MKPRKGISLQVIFLRVRDAISEGGIAGADMPDADVSIGMLSSRERPRSFFVMPRYRYVSGGAAPVLGWRPSFRPARRPPTSPTPLPARRHWDAQAIPPHCPRRCHRLGRI